MGGGGYVVQVGELLCCCSVREGVWGFRCGGGGGGYVGSGGGWGELLCCCSGGGCSGGEGVCSGGGRGVFRWEVQWGRGAKGQTLGGLKGSKGANVRRIEGEQRGKR